MIVCAAAGLTLVASLLVKVSGKQIVGLIFSGCLVVGYFIYTNSFRQWLVTNPLQQIRESVISSRGTLDPAAAEQKTIRTGSFCIPPYLYDAHMERFDSAGGLIAALQRSDKEGVPLFVNIGMPWAARDYSPQMWALFNNRDLFEEPAHLRGFEPSLDRLVAKYKAQSVQTLNLAATHRRTLAKSLVLWAHAHSLEGKVSRQHGKLMQVNARCAKHSENLREHRPSERRAPAVFRLWNIRCPLPGMFPFAS